jgi:hypothetical protein
MYNSKARVLSDEKEYLTVYISKEVKEAFYELVKNKYDSLHGPLSVEVEEALRSHLRAHTQTQIAPIKMNPALPHVHGIMDQIVRKLKDDYDCLLQCDMALLRKAITEVRGSDERTIKKWTRQLLQEKKLKVLGPNLFEIV